MDWTRRALAVAAATGAMLAVPTAAGPLPTDIERFLLDVARFPAADVASVEAGRVIADVKKGASDDEVVVVAAVKIRAPREQVVSYYGQMVAYVDGTVTLGFGRFSTPPVLADVASLTLGADEVQAIKSCRPGDCDLKVGGVGIETLRSSIDWTAPDAADQATRAVRRRIVDYVSAYMARGDEALITYDDRSKPVSLKAQWRGMVAAAPYFHQYSPDLQAYLTGYPRATLAGARDIFYWIREDYGMKPVISLVHGVVYQDAKRADRTMIVQKQIYASHYLEGSVAVATAVGAVDEGRPITYLVYANRSRGDLLRGGFGGLKRKVASDQAKKAAVQTLETIKTQLEAAAR
jgi:hypothetical protein